MNKKSITVFLIISLYGFLCDGSTDLSASDFFSRGKKIFSDGEYCHIRDEKKALYLEALELFWRCGIVHAQVLYYYALTINRLALLEDFDEGEEDLNCFSNFFEQFAISCFWQKYRSVFDSAGCLDRPWNDEKWIYKHARVEIMKQFSRTQPELVDDYLLIFDVE